MRRKRQGTRSLYVWAFAVALMIEAVGQAFDAFLATPVHKMLLWLAVGACLFGLGFTLENYKQVRGR